jgi:hypothetical protein
LVSVDGNREYRPVASNLEGRLRTVFMTARAIKPVSGGLEEAVAWSGVMGSILVILVIQCSDHRGFQGVLFQTMQVEQSARMSTW